MFVQIHESSEVIPLPGVPTLFLVMVSADDITDSKEARSPQDFRGFQLHKVSYVGEGTPVTQVAFPQLQGVTTSHWIPFQESQVTPEMEGLPQLSVSLATADRDHWNITNDPAFFPAWRNSEPDMGLNRPPGHQGQLVGLVFLEMVPLQPVHPFFPLIPNFHQNLY